MIDSELVVGTGLRITVARDELVKLGVEPRRIRLAAPVTVTGSGSDDQARRVDLVVKS